MFAHPPPDVRVYEEGAHVRKLYIYDATTPEDRDQASARFDKSDNVKTLGITSKAHLLADLSRMGAMKLSFSRVLVQTHEEPGCIMFNGMRIYDDTIRAEFAGRGFHGLFPLYTRIYFDGCNVADTSLGTSFLDAVGSTLLKSMGGEVFGWTSYGYGMSSRWPFIGGRTIHFSGYVKKLHFRAGGIQYTPTPERDPFGDDNRVQRGFKQ